MNNGILYKVYEKLNDNVKRFNSKTNLCKNKNLKYWYNNKCGTLIISQLNSY